MSKITLGNTEKKMEARLVRIFSLVLVTLATDFLNENWCFKRELAWGQTTVLTLNSQESVSSAKAWLRPRYFLLSLVKDFQ